MGMWAVKSYIERTGLIEDCEHNPFLHLALGHLFWENIGKRAIPAEKQGAIQ
jgi:hypothetical protein